MKEVLEEIPRLKALPKNHDNPSYGFEPGDLVHCLVINRERNPIEVEGVVQNYLGDEDYLVRLLDGMWVNSDMWCMKKIGRA